MAGKKAQDPGFIDPNRLYTLRGFYNDSGVSPTRVREARREGIEFPTMDMGKRKFIRGHDAIQFIEQLSQQ
jgi:hypothetical protein